MKKFQINKLCAVLSACGLLSILPAMAAPLPLAQVPAGSVATQPPAPNLILTIDNSNSMNGIDSGSNTRMQNLRSALTTAFSAANVPDGAIRLGWNTINPLNWNGGANWGLAQPRDCSEFRSTGPACGPQGNVLRPLTAAHRANFLAWVAAGGNSSTSTNNGLQGFGNTPTPHGYYNALKQYDIVPTDPKSPWAEEPNSAAAGTYHSCRKSYVMLLTDGDYNRRDAAGLSVASSFDLDSAPRALGDGTPYNPAAPYANIYKQAQVASSAATNHLEVTSTQTNFNTLSDLAFHYWANDLFGNATDNNVKPKWNVDATENGIAKYWNPKNDPATWQHVNTYTIGYGTTAAGWSESPKLTGSETLYNSVDLQKLMNGDLSWPQQNFNTVRVQQEMMHAAINGRGKFYPARTGQDVVNAIKDLLVDVIPVVESHVTSASGSTLSAQVDSAAFYASYDSKKWSGNVSAVNVKAGGGLAAGVNPWGGTNTAASLLDAKAPALRKLIAAKGPKSTEGVLFNWATLSAAQQTALQDGGSVTDGQGRLAYLRGTRTGEGTTYRERASVLGDIVNSNVWYMKGVPNADYSTADYLTFVKAKKDANRPNTLFVGANDGMLHAFNATNGQEMFGYVPLGSWSNLVSLSKTSYTHKYFVDGSPFTADYCKTYTATIPPTCSTWRTALVGFMGAGGKGFFMLDVTDPTGVTASNLLWDATSGILNDGTTTPPADPDIGYITQKPVTERDNPYATRQIARMNNGKWALVTGNGYNSTNEKAVLIVHYLDGTATRKIYADSTVGGANGLSAPRLVDLNGDGRPDIAYAGDLKGNLYKFDLAGTDATDWKVAGGAPMFTAKNSSSNVQPITTAPVYQAHPSKGLMVTFGTGRNLTAGDASDHTVQSFYGLYDFGFKRTSAAAGGITVLASADNAQTVWSPTTGTRADRMLGQTIDGTGKITTKTLDVPSDGLAAVGTTYRGWYLDLPEYERVLRNPTWFDGDLISLLSDAPGQASDENDPCKDVTRTNNRYYTTVVNAVSGNAPSVNVWADPSLAGQNRVEGNLATVETRSGTEAHSTCIGSDCNPSLPDNDKNLLGRYFKTPSWRQLQ